MAKATILNHPIFNEIFEFHTDSSGWQLGAVISEGRNPLAFYNRKLSNAQRNYTKTEQELLDVVKPSRRAGTSYQDNESKSL